MLRRCFLASAVAFAFVFSLFNSPVAEAKGPVNASFIGSVAISGADTVAYHTLGKYVPGDDKITASYKGATWRFSSTVHRDLFQANPKKYAPAYGGYCAWAVSQGNTASIDPEAWRIVDGVLYLNYSPGVQKTWEKDIPGNIKAANANWPGILAGLK